MSIQKQLPNNAQLLKTLTLLTAFSIPLCGTMGLFTLLAGLLLAIIIIAAVAKDKPLKQGLLQIKQANTIAYYSGLLWLGFTFISLIIVLLSEHTVIRKIAGLGRQLYIVLEIGFALVLIDQIKRQLIPAKHLLYALIIGFFTLITYQAFAIYSYPINQVSFWSWTPLMAPNIRDTGTQAAAITTICFCLTLFSPCIIKPTSTAHKKSRLTGLLFLTITTLSWTYLMWTGGRTGNAIILLTLPLISGFSLLLSKDKGKGFLLTFITGFLAFQLCTQLTVYEWNGIHRIKNQFAGNIFNLTENKHNNKGSSELQTSAKETKEEKLGHRSMMWAGAWQAFKRSPIIGLGPNGWFFSPEKEASGAVQDQPHNLILQALVEWGAIGAGLFFIMLASLILPKLKQLPLALTTYPQETSQVIIISVSTIFVLSLHSLTSGTYWNFQSVSLVVLIYSLWISYTE